VNTGKERNQGKIECEVSYGNVSARFRNKLRASGMRDLRNEAGYNGTDEKEIYQQYIKYL
jgi:hypothetical protein